MIDRPWIEEFITCDCHDDGLFLSRMSDSKDDPGFVYVSLWRFWSGKPYWRYRLRHIWHIIRHGDPYTDQVILDRKSVERLRHFCDVSLATKVYDRPWMVDLRAGETTSYTLNSEKS